MTEYELEAVYVAIRQYVKAGLQHKALRDRPEDYDGHTRQVIEAEAVAQIYAFTGIITGYGYKLIDGPVGGICQDCYLVKDEHVQDFKNGLYNMRSECWHGDLVNVPKHAVIPIRFKQEIE
jgi:hypothetical protein